MTIESPIGPLHFAPTPQGWVDDITTVPPSPDSLRDLSPFLEDNALLVTRDRDREDLTTNEPHAM